MESGITINGPPSIGMTPIGAYMVENPLMIRTAAFNNFAVHFLYFSRQIHRVKFHFSSAWTDHQKISNVAIVRLDFQSKMKVFVVLLVPLKKIHTSAARVALQ